MSVLNGKIKTATLGYPRMEKKRAEMPWSILEIQITESELQNKGKKFENEIGNIN